jgi:hypothetical protein
LLAEERKIGEHHNGKKDNHAFRNSGHLATPPGEGIRLPEQDDTILHLPPRYCRWYAERNAISENSGMRALLRALQGSHGKIGGIDEAGMQPGHRNRS